MNEFRKFFKGLEYLRKRFADNCEFEQYPFRDVIVTVIRHDGIENFKAHDIAFMDEHDWVVCGNFAEFWSDNIMHGIR